jgi:hypothetical protein
MAPHNSTRVAWSIAVASLALWATSAPVTWGQAATIAERFLQESTDETTSATNTFLTLTDDGRTAVTAADPNTTPCTSVTPASQEPAPAAPQPSSGAQQGSFRVCGADAQTAHAIEQLIAGRPFSATLSAHGDGCADLSIRVTSSNPTSGTASSNLRVSLGTGQNLSIQIVSDKGTTHVNIG